MNGLGCAQSRPNPAVERALRRACSSPESVRVTFLAEALIVIDGLELRTSYPTKELLSNTKREFYRGAWVRKEETRFFLVIRESTPAG